MAAMSRFRDPFVHAVVALVVLAAAAVITLALGWRGVAGHSSEYDELPFFISAGLGALAMLGFAAALLSVQCRRREEARYRAQFDAVVQAAAAILTAVAERRQAGRET